MNGRPGAWEAVRRDPVDFCPWVEAEMEIPLSLEVAITDHGVGQLAGATYRRVPKRKKPCPSGVGAGLRSAGLPVAQFVAAT